MKILWPYYVVDSQKMLSTNYNIRPKDIREAEKFSLEFQLKRCGDLFISALVLISISPVLLLISLLIKLDSPGPIFHKQYRVGLKGCHFHMWKFRTMVPNAIELQQDLETENNASGGVLFKIPDDPRITRVGKFLRRYSLDELPQIINVLQKDMSIVGPRPLVLRDVERMPEDLFFRHDVMPGITGLWQVKGRSSLRSEEIFNWDSIYIDRWSIALDLNILWQTIGVVIKGDGAY
jgi:lipopolysaccharide/colanic/teichoic acid biosynthesis glycosyltransferase